MGRPGGNLLAISHYRLPITKPLRILENRLTQLFLLAISMMSFSAIGLTLGSALFLQHAGASSLPRSYMLMGVVSIPVYLGLSQIVDRTHRPRLFQYFLILALALALSLRLLIVFDRPWVYFVLYISFYIQWTLVTEVLFPSLVTDYFTTLDWKRYAPSLRMATALGGLLGGGLISILSQKVVPENLILILPLFYALVFIQLLYLDHTQTPIKSSPSPNQVQSSTPISRLETLKKYPIIGFLATSTFLTILLYTIGEFLYFSIYAENFTSDRQLTGFLGTMRMINSIIPFIILYPLTQPLLNRIGVMGMNLLYPVTTFLSFLGLGTQGNLISAMACNFNTNGIEDSINQPIQSLNYNAVPYDLVGRIRTISNGLFYSLGLAMAGILLWGLDQFSQLQIAELGLGLSLLFLLVRYAMGKSYLQSLLSLLRSGSTQWHEVGVGLPKLPEHCETEVIELLKSKEIQNQILGLSLASCLKRPQQFLPYIQPLFLLHHRDLHPHLIQFFQSCPHPQMFKFLEHFLQSEDQSLRLLALEAIIASKYRLPNEQLEKLHKNPNLQQEALLCVASIEARSKNPKIQESCNLFWNTPLDETTKLTLIRAIRSTKNRQFIPYLQRLLKDASLEVSRQGLDVLALLARPGEQEVGKLAASQLANVDPLSRAIAFKVMGVVKSPSLLLDVAMGLQHSSLAVRLWAATALANYGEASLKVARVYLYSPRYEVVEMAIATIAKVGTRRAINLLYDFLKPDCKGVAQTPSWIKSIRPHAPYAPFLKTILQDYQKRVIQRVFYILSVLDNQNIIKQIQPLLTSTDPRLRANALETLMSVKHQRFIRPILPLLEEEQPFVSTPSLSESELIYQLSEQSDRWLRLGALLMLSELRLHSTTNPYLIPCHLQEDPHPLVRRIAQSLATRQQEEIPQQDWFLKQLFFLKSTALFHILSLDELEELNPLFYPAHLPAHATLYAGDPHQAKLYLIAEGQVTLYSHPKPLESQTLTLSAGQYFGEIAALENIWYKIVTQTHCTFLTLSSKQFEILIDRCPRLLWCLSQPQTSYSDWR
ncbi:MULTISPECIES: cyclic nucleotide-binding domain-containing protein [unclassified Roseofilum]|uniref:cyclic nucleotide-binding domain-containing protein n=1 Tax=unclassified Roseofilum TaxID=2620099 RepID=UPI001B0D54CC|nr:MULTISPECIES: cyclic nucleotide-binding domain-containing protein [unclassified Roseofilum]MBP0009158.1 cyclic nucleotide-binding domain-containing protein [Roseofilum sp. Belize Diploria]MBP0035562.1 cyclic nucleotide-binding domain-containing protein [Roseofilum sp. Belize BBD 4]